MAMKRLLICTVWFAFTVTPSPIPGQTSPHSADAKSNIQADSKQQKNPTPAPPVVNPAEPNGDKHSAHQPASDDKPHAIRVTELPYLPLGKDWMDRVAWVAGLALVVIAGIGICLANRTLNAIQRQADLQEASMRQWVDVELTGTDTGTRVEASGEIKPDAILRIKFRAVNNTSLPFTIKKIITKISRDRGDQTIGWEVFEVEDEAILPK